MYTTLLPNSVSQTLYGNTFRKEQKTLINIAHPVTETLDKAAFENLVVTTTSFQNKDRKRKQFASSSLLLHLYNRYRSPIDILLKPVTYKFVI